MTLDPRPTDAQLLALQAERKGRIVNGVRLGPESPLITLTPKAKRELNPRSDDPIDPHGRMNESERARAIELEAKRRAGEIRGWHFEAIALILGDRTRYHPDFLIEENDRTITLEEVKGFMRDDAAVKLKVTARLYPFFRIRVLRRRPKGAGWDVREVRA